MAAFEKHIPLSVGTSTGLFTVSTSSASYVETAQPGYALIDTSKYTGGTFYFEAVIKTSAATGYATLWDNTAGAAVSGAEVSTTSTSVVRLRSGALTLTSGNVFTNRIKNDGTNTTTDYGARIVVEQNAGAITNTENQNIIYGYVAATTISATYIRPGTIGMSWFLYTSANFDGTVNIFYEATLKTSAATGYSQLADNSGDPGVAVAGSEVTTTSTSFVRVRSGAITLANATVYQAEFKNDGTNTTTLGNARLIIQQSNTPTKTESYLPAGYVCYASSAATFADTFGRFYYNSAKWVVDTIAWYAEYSRNSNVATGVIEMFALTDAARVAGSNVTTAADYARQRSGALTMPATQEITYRSDSGAGTIYDSVQHLVAVLTWTNVKAAGGAALLPLIEQQR